MYKYCSITIFIKDICVVEVIAFHKTPLTFHSPFLNLMINSTKFDYIFDKISMLYS